MTVHPAVDPCTPDTPPPPGEPRLWFTERFDPEAADALWALALAPGWGQRSRPDAAGGDAPVGDHGAEMAS